MGAGMKEGEGGLLPGTRGKKESASAALFLGLPANERRVFCSTVQ